jgi:hypothetical protein
MLLSQFKCQRRSAKESKICLFMNFQHVAGGHLFCQPETPFPAK